MKYKLIKKYSGSPKLGTVTDIENNIQTVDSKIAFKYQVEEDNGEHWIEYTPEMEANDLGFKRGDKVWNKDSKNYIGKIKSFYKASFGGVGCYISNVINILENIEDVTNKTAIYCESYEDADFISNRLYNKNDIDHGNIYIGIDREVYMSSSCNDKDNYKILTVDEYMEEIGEEPKFITEDDKKNI